ncbi:hypothetical protein Acr_00g0098690 [Actinidia rufa]|uniref:Uncharacterized protein n=1 Tax=Actinidia rufa TaxID=165716 RepID=A0A7J0DZB2_9ERIC|nr:hypothetical protein Acr_00g0098690 [Actinidia rufa]
MRLRDQADTTWPVLSVDLIIMLVSLDTICRSCLYSNNDAVEWSFSEVPGSGASVPASGDNFPESDIETDPAIRAPTLESPLLDKATKELALAKSLSIDKSFYSPHEPLTPDSGSHGSSPAGSPKKCKASEEATSGCGWSIC